MLARDTETSVFGLTAGGLKVRPCWNVAVNVNYTRLLFSRGGMPTVRSLLPFPLLVVQTSLCGYFWFEVNMFLAGGRKNTHAADPEEAAVYNVKMWMLCCAWDMTLSVSVWCLVGWRSFSKQPRSWVIVDDYQLSHRWLTLWVVLQYLHLHARMSVQALVSSSFLQIFFLSVPIG